MMAGIVAVLFGVCATLDAAPSLYLAELYVRRHPDALHKAFGGGAVTLITGASDGIGAEVAKQLCALAHEGDGVHLILMARTLDKLLRVKRDCLARGSKASVAVVVGDVTEGEEAMRNWIGAALQELGKAEVDVAVVNAGRGYRGSVVDTQESLLRDIMELNFMAAVATAKAVMSTYQHHPDDQKKQTQKQKHMIAVSSVAGKLPVPMAAGYAASKAALQAFFDSLRIERSPLLRVTTVCPGPVRTNIRKASRRESMGILTDDNDGDDPLDEAEQHQMPVERAVRLLLAGSVASPAFLFHELWMSPQPILTFVYTMQYLPDLVKFVGRPVGGCNGSALCEEAKRLSQEQQTTRATA